MSITKSNTRMLEGEDLTLTGDLLVGADTTSGDTTNDKSVVSGLFSTKNGTTSIANQGVATTLVTL